MKNLIQRVARKIYIFFFSRVEAPEKPKRKYRKRRGKGGDYTGTQYVTLKDLLGDLDSIFSDVKNLKPSRSDVQAVIKKHGVYMSNLKGESSDLFDTNKLEGFKAYGLPTFICNYIERHELKEDLLNSFFVAIKSKSKGYFVRNKFCDYYECCYVIHPSWSKKPLEIYFYISVNRFSGEVNALKLKQNKSYELPGSKKKNPKRSSKWSVSRIHKTEWQYPTISDETDDLGNYLKYRFIANYNLTMRREYAINVIIKNSDGMVTITVPPDDWKYFFKTRLKAKTKNGNTKPIFHSVSAHTRQTSQGVSNVKTHYRGVRHFEWNGYDISIVIQGRHGVSQAAFDMGGSDDYDEFETGKMIGISEAANTVSGMFGSKSSECARSNP